MSRPSFAHVPLQSSINEDCSSMPISLLAALDHFSSSFCRSELSSSPIYFDGPDVLMVDPFLDYLNDLMMDEQGEEDVPCMRDDVEASYNAIMSSLNDIVSPLNSMFSEPISDSVVLHENASGFHLSTSWNDQDLHADIKTEDQEKTSNPEPLPLSADSTAQPSSIDISLEEFKDSAGYADLYAGKPSLVDKVNSTDRVTKWNGVKKESSRAARKGAQSVRNASAEVGGFVDLKELLVSCAQAVAIGDVKRAREFLQELYQVHGASVKGNALLRVSHYFCDALIARMGGLGGYQYKIMVALPYNALADREGRPPLLVITGIDSSRPHLTSTLEWLEENGRRLAAYAKTYNVRIQFHAIVSDQWEDIDPASFYLQESEVLVEHISEPVHDTSILHRQVEWDCSSETQLEAVLDVFT
ncbi:hypothetical protein L7F22_034892 [Adiantum nelumboides]|nr:hypothetical protein [Adiantum nelumboides]